MKNEINLNSEILEETIIDIETPENPQNQNKLVPCQCPDVIPGDAATIDAGSPIRIVKFDVKIKNLCKNKDFLLCVTIFKKNGQNKTILGQIGKVVRRTTGSDGCADHTETITAAINESLCSNEEIFFEVVANYGNCCNITLS